MAKELSDAATADVKYASAVKAADLATNEKSAIELAADTLVAIELAAMLAADLKIAVNTAMKLGCTDAMKIAAMELGCKVITDLSPLVLDNIYTLKTKAGMLHCEMAAWQRVLPRLESYGSTQQRLKNLSVELQYALYQTKVSQDDRLKIWRP